MKNKIQFILPRLIAVTVIAGLATLIIGTLFKLLVLASILYGIGSIAIAKMRRKERNLVEKDRAPIYPHAHGEPSANMAIVPLHEQQRVKKATIVPVY
jgi:hypothetical protein